MASLSEFATTFIIIMMLAGDSAARDLRPSDHGFHFQNSPSAPANSPMEMFFNSSPATSTSSSTSTSTSTSFTNSMPPSWRRTTTGGGGNHRGGVLMVASLVCGITGVIVLVVTAFLYLFNNKRKRNKPTLNESFRDDSDFNAPQLKL